MSLGSGNIGEGYGVSEAHPQKVKVNRVKAHVLLSAVLGRCSRLLCSRTPVEKGPTKLRLLRVISALKLWAFREDTGLGEMATIQRRKGLGFPDC